MGYVRRRDEIATEKIAAAARRTIPEGSRTTFVVGAYSFGANFPVQPPNFPIADGAPQHVRALEAWVHLFPFREAHTHTCIAPHGLYRSGGGRACFGHLVQCRAAASRGARSWPERSGRRTQRTFKPLRMSRGAASKRLSVWLFATTGWMIWARATSNSRKGLSAFPSEARRCLHREKKRFLSHGFRKQQ